MITNQTSNEKATTDKRGIFTIAAQRGDTLIFTYIKYSRDMWIVRKPTENVNVILMDKQAPNGLPRDYTVPEYKAYAPLHREDEKLYNILYKGAVRDGLWNY